jgi:hypothetical protein
LGGSPRYLSWLPDKLFGFDLAHLSIIVRLRSYARRGQMAQEDRTLFWNRENEVSEEWIQFVDDNALAGKADLEHSIVWPSTNRSHSELPQGTQVIGTFPHRANC